MTALAVGVEIGGSHLAVGVLNDDGALDSFATFAHDSLSVDSVVEAAATAVMERSRRESLPVGVGLAAQLGDDGFVRVAPCLGWRDVPFGRAFAARLGGQRVTVANDLSAVAMGEWRYGAGARCVGPVYCVFIGSGVGSALVVDGRVYGGAAGVAGEIGHVKVRPGGELCGCGERGCLEAYVGGRALARLSGGRMASEIEAAVARGEEWAAPLWGTVVRELPLAIANAIAVLNPAVLILGGGVVDHSAQLFDACVASIRAFAPRVATRGLVVSRSSLGARAGVIGAAVLASTGS